MAEECALPKDKEISKFKKKWTHQTVLLLYKLHTSSIVLVYYTIYIVQATCSINYTLNINSGCFWVVTFGSYLNLKKCLYRVFRIVVLF